VIQVIESSYEPEVTKFGARGIFLAERLFQLSSEIAMATLIDERSGVCSRKTLVPIFMDAVRNAFVPRSSRSFWADYSQYWIEQSGESIAEWRLRFVAKARDLNLRNVPILTPDGALPQASRNAAEAWRNGLTQAVLEFEALQEPKRAGAVALAFTFAHLMNNRLGITPIEESYFSYLLHEVATR
jgi:thiopeptide-type bacteriocin biosynthesis protein